MSFLEKFPKNPTPDEVLAELQRFLNGSAGPQQPQQSQPSASKGVKGKMKGKVPQVTLPVQMNMKELTHSGMWLIRQLPVARDAVFDFISMSYDEFVKDHLSQVEGNSAKFSDEDVKLLDDVHDAFTVFLESCGEIWAPILSQWTLHLLGQLSQDYSNRKAFAHVQSVNEVIHIWMGSKAIQSLLDLTSRCLTCRDHANADAFISALLDTSASHSPHFDWVVAHVGNSYPQTVVSQVLNLGLQNFSSNPPLVSKLSSVVGILGHLVTTHSKEIQHAFDQTLQNGLSDNNLMAEKFSVPYLLQMCSSSVPLLDVLMDSALPRVKEETLQKLRNLVPKWIQLHFGGHEIAIVALVTHLILKSSRGPKALEILMAGCQTWSKPVNHHSRKLLDHFTAEFSSMVYESDSTRKDLTKTFPCISAMKDNASTIIEFLTNFDPQVCRTAKQFVKLLSLYDGPAIGVKAVVHYLRESKEDKHLWHLIDLVGMLEMKYSSILGDSLQILAVKSGSSLSKNNSNSESSIRSWQNVLKILKSESLREKLLIKYKFSTVLQENLSILCPLLDVRQPGFSIKEASIVVEILARIPDFTKKCRFGTLLTIQRHLVEYTFKVLAVNGSNHTEKVKNICIISKLLHELSEDQAIQYDSLRSLVQYCLYPECKQLFIPRVVGNPKLHYSAFDFDIFDSDIEEENEYQPEKFSMYVSLMKENQKRSATSSIAGSHATTFHSGKLLKNGVKNWSALPKVVIKENSDAHVNFELFLSVLLSVCMAIPTNVSGNGNELYETSNDTSKNPKDKGQHVSVEAMRKVALLLVEIVSPDVMFNGLPWPEEEFSKVQVERDLQIRRSFEEHPYLWDLLELVANHCPSLCYCSVLLRALMATLMAHWTSCQESQAKRTPIQLEWTIRLLNIMRTGKVLPEPLCFIGQVVHELKANEIVGLLKDIWHYMRVNVPVPTIFVKDPVTKKFVRNSDCSRAEIVFTERLRLTILNNVEGLGYLYPKLFPVQLHKENDNQNQGKNGSETNGNK